MTTSVIYVVTQENAGCDQYIFITHVKQHTDDSVATYIEQGTIQYNLT